MKKLLAAFCLSAVLLALPTTPPLTLSQAQTTATPKLKVSWDASPVVSEEGFAVESGPALSGPFVEVVGNLPKDTANWTDPATKPGVLTCYRVRSWNTLGNNTRQFSGYAGPVCGKTSPETPGNLTVAQEAIAAAMQQLEKATQAIDAEMQGSRQRQLSAPQDEPGAQPAQVSPQGGAPQGQPEASGEQPQEGAAQAPQAPQVQAPVAPPPPTQPKRLEGPGMSLD